MNLPENLLDFEIDATGFSEEDLENKGGSSSVNAEGFYHVSWSDPEPEQTEGKVPCVKITGSVVAGTDETQLNKNVYHRFNLAKKGKDGSLEPLSDGSKKNMIKFFANQGLLKREEVAGQKFRLPWERLSGHQCIVQIKNEPYDEEKDGVKTGVKKDSFKIPYGCNVWAVDDEYVAKYPKNPEYLALLTGGGGIGNVDDI